MLLRRMLLLFESNAYDLIVWNSLFMFEIYVITNCSHGTTHRSLLIVHILGSLSMILQLPHDKL